MWALPKGTKRQFGPYTGNWREIMEVPANEMTIYMEENNTDGTTGWEKAHHLPEKLLFSIQKDQ